MSISQIISHYGAWRVVALALSIILYLTLHATRAPFVLVSRGMSTVLSGLDRRITASVSAGDRHV